jgi:prevent-host-death family protein
MKVPTQIAAGEFKATCLGLLDQVESTRREIVITKRGRPVAKLVPFGTDEVPIFGRMRGSVTILGDIVSSVDEVWNCEACDTKDSGDAS